MKTAVTAPDSSSPVKGRVVASYVTSWTDVMPDPFLLTHVNYAFGHVKRTFDGVRIDNIDRLKAVQGRPQFQEHDNLTMTRIMHSLAE